MGSSGGEKVEMKSGNEVETKVGGRRGREKEWRKREKEGVVVSIYCTQMKEMQVIWLASNEKEEKNKQTRFLFIRIKEE